MQLELSVNVNGCLYCQNVRIHTEPDDLATANSGDEGFVAEFLTCMDIREVDFDRRDTNGRDGIAESNTGVGKGRRIENYDVNFAFGLLNPGHKLAFGVGLTEVHFDAEFACSLRDQGLDIRQGSPTVHIRLTLAEEVQVWAVQN